MKPDDAVQALSALAYGARMEIFRHLVAAGDDGLSAGRIAELCGMSASTLSFHLNQLKAAGLVANRRVGRSQIYSANVALMETLIGYLDGTLHPGSLAVEAHLEEPFTVLFLGTRNASRSIMAEAIVNRQGHGRVRALSAGLIPAEEISGVTARLLHRLEYDIASLHPKSVATLSGPAVPRLHAVITLSDEAAEAPLPALPGDPVRVAWRIPDPQPVIGTEAEINAFSQDVFHRLHARLSLLLITPARRLDRASLQHRLEEIDHQEAATAGVA